MKSNLSESENNLPEEYLERLKIVRELNRVSPENPEAYMRTLRIIAHIEPLKYYVLAVVDKKTRVKVVESKKEAVKPDVKEKAEVKNPKFVELENTWTKPLNNGSEPTKQNILGKDGSFYLNGKKLNIPEAEASEANLAFYGSKLVDAGEAIKFDTDVMLPVTVTEVGKDYAKDFLVKPELGGGVYIEHHKAPHLHMKYYEKAGGHLILGKFSEDGSKIYLSAFKIPNRKAIYTPPGVLHCDAFLAGKYVVVYSPTKEYSTVIFKDKKGGIVDLEIDEIEDNKVPEHLKWQVALDEENKEKVLSRL